MRGALEVADVFRRHGDAYREAHAGHLSIGQRRVMAAIETCRSAALGGHVEHCEDCGQVRISYNSCRNRHCPKCQGLARAEWLADRRAELLPVPYFHVVFTVPAPVAEIAFQNKAVVYGILFKAAAETLRIIAADPKHLGAEIGLIAVLHTWGQNLHHHPHVHCVVPGGGPALDGSRWVGCRPGFFLPVAVLSRLYRRLFLSLLQAAFDSGQLRFFGDLAALASPTAFAACLRPLRRTSWGVYAKPPFGGPGKVLDYLARYTHRVAIANSRLVAVGDGHVSFRWKKLWDGRREGDTIAVASDRWRCPMATQIDDLSRSLVALEQDTTLIAAVELSQSSWLVGAMVPGLERRPQKKLEPDPSALLRLLERWRDEGVKAGRTTRRIVLAFEAGRDGFWLARWLRKRGIESHVIHSTSVAVSREHRRAKTDRLDLAMLLRVFLGWLRGERKHCSMVAIPTLEQEDAKRPSRERESLTGEKTRIVNRMKGALARLGIRGFKPELRKAPQKLATLSTPEGVAVPPNTLAEIERDMTRLAMVRMQIAVIERTRLERLHQAPADRPNAMVLLLARVIGIGVETADMLVREILSRNLRDRRAVARYAGTTGSPDESGSKRREKGLARAGNARVRRGLNQLAWRFLVFQKDSALAQWYRARTEGSKGARKTTMIVALARKLLIALWRLVTTGEVPQGVVLRPAA